VGPTPIQNVGAYGQEVADTIRSLRVLDRRTLEVRELPAAECGLSYRNSIFRRDPGQAIVLSASFALRPGAQPVVAYRELAEALAGRDDRRCQRCVRRCSICGARIMVHDTNDPTGAAPGRFSPIHRRR